MIVSRRRGRARGCGSAVRSGSVSVGTAVEENKTPAIPHGVPSRGTWVGVKSYGRGGSFSS